LKKSGQRKRGSPEKGETMDEKSIMDWSSIVISIVSLIGICITAWLGYLGQKHAKQVNDAVNHRHKRGTGSPKLYDLALENSKRISGLVDWKAETTVKLDRIQNTVAEIKANQPQPPE